jgi:hypothetical protein
MENFSQHTVTTVKTNWVLPEPWLPELSFLCLLYEGKLFRTEDAEGRLSEALGNLGSGNLEGGGIGERVEKGEVSLQAT